MKNVQKAIAITDAKISFVSLVDKAANKRNFLIAKQEDGKAQFSTYGRIIKTDADSHFVTGIVYEPMTEDAHGNFMTEAEITKAAYWFAKNGSGVDLQHNFETFENASVVESWVAKADFDCNGETVKKGTWLMTVEVTDDGVWDAIQKGEITGFSMGGVGIYDTEDTDLESVEKNAPTPTNDPQATERKGILKKLAGLFGFDVVEKGVMADEYKNRAKASNFWNAFYTLEDILYRYDYSQDRWTFESDETVIREALTDFNTIIGEILASESGIAKSLAVTKAGKTLSAKNKEALTNIYTNLGEFLAGVENETEETEMTKAEIEQIVADAIAKATTPAPAAEGTPTDAPVDTPATETPAAPAEITEEAVEKMVAAAIAKALAPTESKPLTAEDVNDIVEKAVKKAVEPILKSRALPTAIGEGNADPVEKGEAHYLAGIL